MPPATSDRAAALSLPSFAQAFSSLGSSDDRALPPIHAHHHQRRPLTRSPPSSSASPALSRPTVHHHHRPAPPSSTSQRTQAQAQRKRPRENDDSAHDEGPDSSDHSSPRPNVIKQEQEHDQLDPTPTPSPKPSLTRLKTVPQRRHTPVGPPLPDREIPMNVAALPPSLSRPTYNQPFKRRRVTISGVALNTSNLPSADGSLVRTPTHTHNPLVHTGSSTPISPVVMGFTIHRDDPNAIEQVRAMLSVKQKQKALIESRRGSVSSVGVTDGRRGSTAGLLEGRRGSVSTMHPAVTPTPSVHIVNPTPTMASAPGSAISGPTAAPGPKRSGHSPHANGAGVSRLGPSPPSMTVSSGVTHSPNNSQRSSPLISTNSAKPSSVSASNSSSNPANPPASANTAGATPGTGTGPGVSGPGNAGNAPGPASGAGAAAGPGGRPISPSVHIASARAQPGSAPLTNRSPPSQHQYAGPGHAAHQHAHSHSHSSQGMPASSHPSQASQSGANANARDIRDAQPPHSAQLQQHATRGLSALADNLPPPPTSFARRRAGQLGMRGNKPADIVISPRDSDAGANSNQGGSGMGMQKTPSISSYKSLQPAIQSAPPVPRPGQEPGRFPMALPSLPPALNQRSMPTRRAPGQVPPTPTRLSMQRTQGTTESASVRLSHPTNSLTVPPHGIMPATPATLHRATNTSTDKAAFLAPFEQFYDALSDAQVLKSWFGEQLRRVGKVVKDAEAQRLEIDKARMELDRQREEMSRLSAASAGGLQRGEIERLVSNAVQQEVGAWKEEVHYLRGRVHELEDVLRGNRLERDARDARVPAGAPMGRQTNGVPPASGAASLAQRPSHARGPSQPTPASSAGAPAGSESKYPIASDSYTFPPVQPPPSGPSSSAGPTHPPQHHEPPNVAAAAPSHGVRWEKRQRSISPVPRRSLRDRGSRSRERGGRSLSRSAASSPAPSMDSTVGGSGIARRLSVSAMRYEPPVSARPPVDPSGSKYKSSAGEEHRPASAESASTLRKGSEKSNSETEKPDLKRHNSHHGSVSAIPAKTESTDSRSGHSRQSSNKGASSLSAANASASSNRPPSPMDEDEDDT